MPQADAPVIDLHKTARIQFHKAPMQFHAWKYMIRLMPYASMRGPMTYRLSMQLQNR